MIGLDQEQWHRGIISLSRTIHSLSVAGIITLAACSNQIVSEYEATAATTYTWQVEYAIHPASAQSTRLELFASNTLINRNGMKPDGAITGPDDRGLWWGVLPPRPTVDELEQRQQTGERIGPPRLIKSVQYQIRYLSYGQTKILPTNYDVYRQVVKAYPTRTPLELTVTPGEASVSKADPQ